MNPGELSIGDFAYHLPPDRIAQHPLEQRDESKLLIYEHGNISEDKFLHLANHLPDRCTLVFNNTKVIHARIIFKNENDAAIEVFLLEPESPFRDLQRAMEQQTDCTWRCFIGNAKKWREEKLTKNFSFRNENMTDGKQEGTLEVTKTGTVEDEFLIHLKWQPENLSLAKVLDASGFVPLPPYIKRNATKEDEEQYQTIYAANEGSVAAPTAGLHFTERVFDSLKKKNIQALFTTLHVSAGTFLPVKSTTMKDHPMHSEQIVIQTELIEKLLEAKEKNLPVVAVGTTSLRTIESLYWLGKKLWQQNEEFQIGQWEPYEIESSSGQSLITVEQSLSAVLNWMKKNNTGELIAETKILIAPGYNFKMADGLITNFHLPQSTLLLLIAALIGDDWRHVYNFALHNNFRFLSYGDSSLLWKKR